MRRNGRTLHAAIGIADGRDGRRPRGVGIGRYAKGLPQMHRSRGRLHIAVLRGHCVGNRGLGLRSKSHDLRLGLDCRQVHLSFHLDRLRFRLRLRRHNLGLLQLHLGRLRRRRQFGRRRLLDLHRRRRLAGNDQLRHLVLLLDHLLGRHAHIHSQRQNRHVDDGAGDKSSGPAFGLGQQT